MKTDRLLSSDPGGDHFLETTQPVRCLCEAVSRTQTHYAYLNHAFSTPREAFSCDTTDSTRSCGNTLQGSLVNDSYDSLMLSMQRTLSTRVGFSCVSLSHPHFNCVGQVLGFPFATQGNRLTGWKLTWWWWSYAPFIWLRSLFSQCLHQTSHAFPQKSMSVCCHKLLLLVFRHKSFPAVRFPSY